MTQQNCQILISNLPDQNQKPKDTILQTLLLELFTQIGPVYTCKLLSISPRKRQCIIDFVYPESVDYAIQVMKSTKLFDKVLGISPVVDSRETESKQNSFSKNEIKFDNPKQTDENEYKTINKEWSNNCKVTNKQNFHSKKLDNLNQNVKHCADNVKNKSELVRSTFGDKSDVVPLFKIKDQKRANNWNQQSMNNYHQPIKGYNSNYQRPPHHQRTSSLPNQLHHQPLGFNQHSYTQQYQQQQYHQQQYINPNFVPQNQMYAPPNMQHRLGYGYR